jgi:hypothetical protein
VVGADSVVVGAAVTGAVVAGAAVVVTAVAAEGSVPLTTNIVFGVVVAGDVS